MTIDKNKKTLIIPREWITSEEVGEHLDNNPSHRGWAIRGETEDERIQRLELEYLVEPKNGRYKIKK